MNRKNRYLWLLWSGILGGGVTVGEWVVRSTDAYAALNFSSDYHGILGCLVLLVNFGVPFTVGLISGWAFDGSNLRRMCAGITGGVWTLSVSMLIWMTINIPYEPNWWPDIIVFPIINGVTGAAGGFCSTELSRHLQKFRRSGSA